MSAKQTTISVAKRDDLDWGDARAPKDSLAWAKSWRAEIENYAKGHRTHASILTLSYETGAKHRAWEKLRDKRGKPFESFLEFATCERPYGCGFTREQAGLVQRTADPAFTRAIQYRATAPVDRLFQEMTLDAATLDDEWPEKLSKNTTKTGEKTIKACLQNAILILNYFDPLVGAIRYCTFKRRKMKTKALPFFVSQQEEWCDNDTSSLRAWLHSAFAINLSVETVTAAVELVAHRNAYDGLTERIDAMQWDGITRVNTMLKTYFGAEDTPLNRIFSRRFLITLMARAYEPGCKVDTMLVLRGKQGAKKSSGLRALVGEEYFTDDPIDFGSKEGMQAIAETWLHEIPELDSMKRSEATMTKAYLSKCVDRFRLPYGREPVTRPRRCVFAGTTNEDIWGDDSTGARRFWPVRCLRPVDIEGLQRDRELILAEARELYRAGEKYWIDESEQMAAEARKVQAATQHEHPWAEMVQAYLSNLSDYEKTQGLSHVSILTDAIGIEKDKIRKGDTMQLAKVMQSLGWARSEDAEMRKGARVRLYRPEVAESQPAAANDVPRYDDDTF